MKIFKISVFFLTALYNLHCFAADRQSGERFSETAHAVQKEFTPQIPALLSGIWEGKDRFVYFASIEDSKNSSYAAVMLKTLYGWYYDRAAEPEKFSENKRDLNSVTALDAESVLAEFSDTCRAEAEFRTVSEDENSGVWEVRLTYADRSFADVPVAVIDGKLYLNFWIRDKSVNLSEDNLFYGYWKGAGRASGITASEPFISRELTSFYIVDDSVYHIRYWQTDMEYSPLAASFSDGEKTFYVAKHIASASKIYTCVSGRSVRIRNVERSPFDVSSYTFDSSYSICALGEPYMVLRKGASEAVSEIEMTNAYAELAVSANSRRKPDPPPLFPPSDLNWHWDDIFRLEKDNPLIKSFRERQKRFLTERRPLFLRSRTSSKTSAAENSASENSAVKTPASENPINTPIE
ncbi:hypothetical protein [Treponema parvum]|uniref:hypothetical protein n=1 Tax=Treponema parvum TaxID=138851 RepID=UPI001AEC398F|nr:hypothetical protein [Treponema parvum]QTQ16337.1 hypothetical protein HXT04_06330 [Treponema parvum]